MIDWAGLREQRLVGALAEATADLESARSLELQQLRQALSGHRHDMRGATQYVAALQARLRALRTIAWDALHDAFPEERCPGS